jgi:hypothetical protein
MFNHRNFILLRCNTSECSFFDKIFYILLKVTTHYFHVMARRGRIKQQEEGKERVTNMVEPSEVPACHPRYILNLISFSYKREGKNKRALPLK